MNATNASSLIAPEEPNLDCITPTSISAVTLPTPRLPDTNIQTVDGETLGLMDMLSVLGSGIVIVPFVAILQSIGIGKSLAERGNYKGISNFFIRLKIDQPCLVTARNDFFAVGVGGIASSIVSSMPVSGCFSRSSLNFESNAATQLGNIITAVAVLISALLFAENFRYATYPYSMGHTTLLNIYKIFRWIPTASLAAVIMAAVGSMFDLDAILEVIKLNKKDAVPMLVTFFLSVYGNFSKALLTTLMV